MEHKVARILRGEAPLQRSVHKKIKRTRATTTTQFRLVYNRLPLKATHHNYNRNETLYQNTIYQEGNEERRSRCWDTNILAGKESIVPLDSKRGSAKMYFFYVHIAQNSTLTRSIPSPFSSLLIRRKRMT